MAWEGGADAAQRARVRIREDGFWLSQSASGANPISPEGSHKRSFCKA